LRVIISYERITKAEEQIMQILWKLKKAFVNDVIGSFPCTETPHEYFPLIAKEKYTRFYLNVVMKRGISTDPFTTWFFFSTRTADVHEIDELV